MKLCPRWSCFYRQSMIDENLNHDEIFGEKNSAISFTLEPTDVLYLPAFWFHRVESEAYEEDQDGFVIAVNFWSDSLEQAVSSELYSDYFFIPILDKRDKLISKVRDILINNQKQEEEQEGKEILSINEQPIIFKEKAFFVWLNVLVSRLLHQNESPKIEHLESFLKALYESRYFDWNVMIKKKTTTTTDSETPTRKKEEQQQQCLFRKRNYSDRLLIEFSDLFQSELFQIENWISPIQHDSDLIQLHLENYSEDLLFLLFNRSGKSIGQFLSNCFS